LADFIKSAGGLNEKAYPKSCEIIRYYIEDGERKKRIINLPLSQASNFLIKKHDEINIKRVPNWDKRMVVTLKGEVRFPGEYVIHSGEKLASVIERAGGFTDRAFLYGAIFTRKSVREIQRKALQEELSKLKEQVILVNVRNSSIPNRTPANITGIIQAVDSLIAESKRFQPQGRITINLEDDLIDFENSPSNLTLEDGDVLRVPSYNDTVVVNGEVMLPTALTYEGGDIKTYIDKSGGLTHLADNEHIYVIHANGEAEKANLGSWLFSSNETCIRKGDVITVPKKFYYDTRNIELTKDIADIFYKLSLTVAAAHTVGAI
jgi:protein involved in polysaccharide export with SLBB domain